MTYLRRLENIGGVYERTIDGAHMIEPHAKKLQLPAWREATKGWVLKAAIYQFFCRDDRAYFVMWYEGDDIYAMEEIHGVEEMKAWAVNVHHLFGFSIASKTHDFPQEATHEMDL